MLLEQLPRLAIGLDFLRKHPLVRIHVHGDAPYTLQLLQLLGVSSDRVTKHNWLRVPVMLYPEPVPCVDPHGSMLWALRRELFATLEFPVDKDSYEKEAGGVWQLLLVHRRSGARMIRNFVEFLAR